MITIDYVIQKIRFYKRIATVYRKDVSDLIIKPWKQQKIYPDINLVYEIIDTYQMDLFAYESRLLKERGVMIL